VTCKDPPSLSVEYWPDIFSPLLLPRNDNASFYLTRFRFFLDLAQLKERFERADYSKFLLLTLQQAVSQLLGEVKRLTMDQNGKSFIIFNPF
jgi:hypothetical protein